ncbi:MAG TPA: thiamine phosphate synthase [Candidatus Dormibacteraeota bacterium]|nr:thiamine phosphate synthase [Candidatus Dormibacteraeota bacterium]
MKPLSDCRLYAFIDTGYLRGRTPAETATELCKGGADLIQLRAKQSSREQIRQMAESILPVLRSAGVGLVINDYPDIACEIGAELCHLGQEDFFDAGHTQVSEIIPHSPAGKALEIGLSTHGVAQARKALDAGAHYIAIGPVFATDTKPTAKPVTLDYVRWAAGNVRIPWFAIGGITLNNIDEVVAAGAKRVCVVSAILNANDVAAACREFKARLP